LQSSPIPQCEFDPIAYANPVIDFPEIVPDDVFADPEFLGDFFVLQSLGYQLDDSQLAPAVEPSSVGIHEALTSRQISHPQSGFDRGGMKVDWLSSEGRSTSK
jgi:hypothetical protein